MVVSIMLEFLLFSFCWGFEIFLGLLGKQITRFHKPVSGVVRLFPGIILTEEIRGAVPINNPSIVDFTCCQPAALIA